jgi:hypothetical protein
MLGWLVNTVLNRMWEEEIATSFEVQSRLPGETDKNRVKPPVREARLRADF